MIFDTIEDQESIMNNAYKLRDAPAHLKTVSIGYDLTLDERAIVRDKVNEVKTESQNDPNYVYRVRGPPWDMKVVKLPKRNRDNASQ